MVILTGRSRQNSCLSYDELEKCGWPWITQEVSFVICHVNQVNRVDCEITGCLLTVSFHNTFPVLYIYSHE